MLRIGITGINGLIGRHLHAYLHGKTEAEIVPCTRDDFCSTDLLSSFVGSCDAIVHLAGMNRGENDELVAINIDLTNRLIDACERNQAIPHILFSSSTHIYRRTPYGHSKIKCANILQDWSQRNNSLVSNLILPNIFGEGGKPFYNSVVSTFCYQIANGHQTEIIHDITTEQLHTQNLARQIWRIIKNKQTGNIPLKGARITVSQLDQKIKGFSDLYKQHVIPHFSNPFDFELFNTYRSYLYPAFYPKPVELHTDDRGSLFEAVKSMNKGQTFISTTKPGVVRGNHYHTLKLERFLVIKGQADIGIRKLFSEQIERFSVNGDDPAYIDIPTLHTHNIKNTGTDDLITLFWSHDLFDPDSPDTFNEEV